MSETNAPQPVASRERVAEVLDAHGWQRHPVDGWDWAGCACGWHDLTTGSLDQSTWKAHRADALLTAGVFREPPTREEMVEAISARLHITTDTICDGGKPRHLSADTSAVYEAADAVLALINGG